MKYLNKLTDTEITDIFKSFMATDAEFVSLDIDRYEDSVELNGVVKEPDFENPEEMMELEESYSLDDYNVKAYDHSGGYECQKNYRKYMYKKFKTKYAKEYFLN